MTATQTVNHLVALDARGSSAPTPDDVRRCGSTRCIVRVAIKRKISNRVREGDNFGLLPNSWRAIIAEQPTAACRCLPGALRSPGSSLFLISPGLQPLRLLRPAAGRETGGAPVAIVLHLATWNVRVYAWIPWRMDIDRTRCNFLLYGGKGLSGRSRCRGRGGFPSDFPPEFCLPDYSRRAVGSQGEFVLPLPQQRQKTKQDS